MYASHETQEATDVLNDRLQADASGELLMKLIEQLHASQAEVSQALDSPHTGAEQELLQRLQEAIRLSVTAMREVWEQFHQRPAPL